LSFYVIDTLHAPWLSNITSVVKHEQQHVLQDLHRPDE